MGVMTRRSVARSTGATRGAEGLDRRAFTVAEVERMQELGIFHPDEKFELVEGEIVPMQAKSPVHELIKNTLNRELVRSLPDDLWLGVETTIFLSERTALDPDISISPSSARRRKLTGADIVLAIEVSNATPGFDRGVKARLYARHGVQELWVIDTRRRRTFVHRGPREDGTWAQVETIAPEDPLVHPAIPGFTLRLADV